jgi:hypothetical protein
MMCTGVAHYDWIEVFTLTTKHQFLKFLWWGRILGIIRQISRTDNQPSFCPIFITIYQNCYQIPTRESW